MILEVKDITKNFGEKSVLKGISFSAQSGEALGLLGRNGAGKTTTIRIIMQLFPPNSGEVLVDGKPLSIREINVGYMPEERGLYPKKKIMEQLIYFAELKGVSKDVAIERANKLLDRLQMTEYKDAKLETLSKGNQQKIQLVTTLISNPDIVILDEPFSGLDPVNAMLLKDVVRELIADGKIVIFSSHQMNYIEEFCNNIVIINGG
ncbi:MAG: ATP-binding cassette domain-containing protein, partial [Clostridia bacterium]|nr:ATP-binding cassette domain-containing protein [Clostridia bacterium]